MNSLRPNHPTCDRTRSIRPQLILFLSVAATLMAGNATAASSATVQQHGITWTFSEPLPVGQYANGDYFVVGPVTITSITPASTTVPATDKDGNAIQWTKNGTMINPPPSYLSSAQGMDSSIYRYAGWSAELNVSPTFTGKPLAAPAGSSIVSSVSKSTPCTNTSVSQFTVMAVLTVVDTAPAPGAFRPPISGSDKTSHWNKSQLNYSILRSQPPVASTPPLAAVESYFEKPWICFHEAASVQAISPGENMLNYGRDQANQISIGMLSLHLNYSNEQKEKLYIRLVQYGIDLYGSLKVGQIYTDNGAQNNGRKAPLVLAAMALNDPQMKQWADGGKRVPNKVGYPVQPFAEDSQTWVVTDVDVGRVLDNSTRPRVTYAREQVGLPEWGERHTTDPKQDTSAWGDGYRWVGASQLGCALAVRMIPGGVSAWNHQVFFDYEDRYWSKEKDNPTWTGVNGINPFVYNMRKTYESLPSVPPLPPGGLKLSY